MRPLECLCVRRENKHCIAFLRFQGSWRVGISICLSILAVAALPAAAQAPRPERLQGEVLIGGATLVDPPPGEARDSHAYFSITGAAARRLFDAMRGPIRAEGCEPGQRSRRQGPLACSLGPRRQDASCSFAIDLRSGALAPGLPC